MKLNNYYKYSPLIFLFFLCFQACQEKEVPLYPPDGSNNTEPVVYNWSLTADSLQDKTYTAFLSRNGKYFNQDNQGNATFHYWRNAHVMDILVDGLLRTNNNFYKTRMANLLSGIKETNNNTLSINFYDDMDWLALASLRAYKATNEQPYMDAVNFLWNDIKTGINSTMGGGVAWRKSQTYYKNTPATAPAIILAARLYQMNKNAQDLTIAKDLYTWLKNTLTDPQSGIVWDGINANNDGQLDKRKYTYNQGVYMGAGLELYKATGESTYLNDAIKCANATMSDLDLAPAGYLRSEGQGDGGLFKGILVRYMTLLALENAVPKIDKDKIIAFLKINAQTLYVKGISRPQLFISPDWQQKPGATTDLSTQLSGVMMIEAAALLQDNKLL